MKKALKIIGIVIGVGVLLYVVVGLFLYLYLGKAYEFADAADRGDIPAMEKMIEEGYNPAKTYFGVNQLHYYLVIKINKKELDNVNINVIKFMLKNGVLPNDNSKHGFSILQKATRFNSDELIKILLEAGADVNYLSPAKYRSFSVVDAILRLNKYHLIPLLESYGAKPACFVLPENYITVSSCIMNTKCEAELRESCKK